ADGEEGVAGAYVGMGSGWAVATLPGLDIDGERILSSDDVTTSAADPPGSLIVLGSGAVGVEFASMYRDFGTDVTIVEILDRIVPAEDPEISPQLARAFGERGIRVLTGTRADPASLEKTDGGVAIGVTGEDGEETLKADALLVAVGRRALTEDLNLAATEVEVNERGLIRVDEFYRT